MSAPNTVQHAIEALVEHLESRQARGEKRVWLTPRARKDLRAIPETLRALASGASAPSAAPASAAPAPPAKTPVSTPAPARTPDPAPKSPGTLQESKESAAPAAADSPAPKPAPATPSTDTVLIPEGSSKAEKLQWLREKAANWQPARDLDSLRDTMVFAVGNPEADLMFVGEAPGGEEERQREPFVGPAGQLLTKIIGAMGLQRTEVYISNICKFRPALPNQRESNRKPTAQEMAACLPFVMAEIEIIQPKVIVALGATAMEGLLQWEKAAVSRNRGKFHDFNGIPLAVTYHPSYLLHNQELTERRKVWEDMMMVMERLGMPISDKQRGFFQK